MPRRISHALTAALAVALALPVAAQASGGASIAEAPSLTYGQLEGGGGLAQEFWRLPLYTGDQVTFTVDVAEREYRDFELYAPATTDYSLSNAQSVSRKVLEGGKREFKLTSPFTGLGVLEVLPGSHYEADPYTFTATVSHATTLAVTAPRLARKGSTVTVHATVQSPAGVPEGNCLIDGTSTPLASGGCSASVHLPQARRDAVRVSFLGSDGWQNASSDRSIRLLPARPHRRRWHRNHHARRARRHGNRAAWR